MFALVCWEKSILRRPSLVGVLLIVTTRITGERVLYSPLNAPRNVV